MGRRARPRWKDHPARGQLRALLAAADALTVGSTCTCATATSREDALCCLFGVTGREPYPTPLELCEVSYAQKGTGRAEPKRARRALPVVDGACPLLSSEGRCTIYESRPFGCRTFFCRGHEPSRRQREAINEVGRLLASLSARFFPKDPGPRPLTRALSGSLPEVPP